MDSFENLIPPLPATEAAVLDAASPRPIKIVRDGILAFISSISLTVAMVVVVFIAEMIRGTINLRPSGSFKPTPEFVMGGLLAAELPFAVVALFLRWRYQSTRRAIPPLLRVHGCRGFSWHTDRTCGWGIRSGECVSCDEAVRGSCIRFDEGSHGVAFITPKQSRSCRRTDLRDRRTRTSVRRTFL